MYTQMYTTRKWSPTPSAIWWATFQHSSSRPLPLSCLYCVCTFYFTCSLRSVPSSMLGLWCSCHFCDKCSQPDYTVWCPGPLLPWLLLYDVIYVFYFTSLTSYNSTIIGRYGVHATRLRTLGCVVFLSFSRLIILPIYASLSSILSAHLVVPRKSSDACLPLYVYACPICDDPTRWVCGWGWGGSANISQLEFDGFAANYVIRGCTRLHLCERLTSPVCMHVRKCHTYARHTYGCSMWRFTMYKVMVWWFCRELCDTELY